MVGDGEPKRHMNRYLVDTEAPIEAVRDALIQHITIRLGHVVYINAHESIPLIDNVPPPKWVLWRMAFGLVCAVLGYATGSAVWLFFH